MNTETKDKIIRLRLTGEQYILLKKRARDEYLKISDYIRQRIFNEPDIAPPLQVEFPPDPKTRFNCDHDREMMRCMMRAYLYMKAMAISTLGEEEYKTYNDHAKTQLKEWGYE